MAAEKPRVPITPATRVADLLDAWPELEEVLIAQAPAFRRLRNPVLRRTVAKVATLEQAASVGGLAVRDLVAALRRAAGLDQESSLTRESGEDAPSHTGPAPDWVDSSKVVSVIDADALLDAGRVPLAVANEHARRLGPGELLRVDSSFRPVPLVEAFARQGYRCHAGSSPGGRFETFIGRGEPGSVSRG